jgi:photosystem II stability/assembly factor-like uncharacterized protein
MLKRLTNTAVFFVTLSFLFTPHAKAQWTEIQQFPAKDGFITASWFFNPQVGIIGFEWNISTNNQGMVKRTTDGGATWIDCTVPMLNNTTPIVKDIWFSDQDSGWMVISGKLNINDPLLWRTTDGGKTWNALPNEPPFVGPASVRQTPSALTVTEPLGVGIWTSTDEGITWSSHSSLKNGLGFTDNLMGVATEYKKGDPTSTFLTTSDGGLNWNTVPGGIQHEAFGVYPIKNTRTFVVAPEDTAISGVAQPSPVLRSIDYGQHWTQATMLPMQTTGGIHGVNGVVYVQNSGAVVGGQLFQGLMRSIDTGKTWVFVGGPSQGDGTPYPITDTRFSVTGCGDIVYASDGGGGLWKTTDGGDSTLIIPQCVFIDTDKLAPAISIICDTDKNLYYLHNPNYGIVIVESVAIFDSTRRPDTTGAVFINVYPEPYAPIKPGDSVGFGLAWHPGAMMDSAASDSVTIQVIFQVNYYQPDWGLNPLDTVYLRVSLQGLSVPADYALSAKSITADTLNICNVVDTTIRLINRGCDSLAITQALLAKNNWTLETLNLGGDSLSLPIHIGPGDTLLFRLRDKPISPAIISDSLEVTMHYMGRDTSFGAGLHTSAKLNTLRPALSIPTTLVFDSLATCDSTENILALANTGCDTLTITKADLADIHYELLDTNGNPLTLPLSIPADSVHNVLVRFVPTTLGTHNTTLRFHYKYFGFDSSNVIALSGAGAPSGKLVYPDTINFGNVPICGTLPANDTLMFVNTSCNAAFVDSLKLPAPFLLIDSTVLPKTIGQGSSLLLRIQYKPTQKTIQSGKATFFYSINGGSTSGDGSIILIGTGVAGLSTFATNPPLTSNLFNFQTLSQCDPTDSVTFTIYNTGCDTLRVNGLVLDPSLSGTFAAHANKPLPAALSDGDSIHITLAITNLVAGSYSGNLTIQYTLANGTIVDSLVPVSLTVTQGGGPSVLTMTTPSSLAFPATNQCTSIDTTITFTYQGCGTLAVHDSLTGSGFVLTNPSDSVLLISPGTPVTIHVVYNGTTTDSLKTIIFFRSSAATNPMDTVRLLGLVQPPGTVHFVLGLTNMPVSAGDIFSATLTPDAKVSAGMGLQEVHGVFQYRRDNFEPGSMTTSDGQLDPNDKPYDIGKIEYFPFHVTKPSGIALDPTIALVTLPMETMISDSVGGVIQVDSISLNGGDVQFSNCVLSTNTPGGQNTSISIQCGDSLLISVLNGQPIVTSEQPRPDPVTEENGFQTTLNLHSAANGVAEIILYDAIGEEISHDQLTLSANGTLPYTFHMSNLPAGSYYYGIRFTNATMTSGTLRGTLLLIK